MYRLRRRFIILIAFLISPLFVAMANLGPSRSEQDLSVCIMEKPITDESDTENEEKDSTANNDRHPSLRTEIHNFVEKIKEKEEELMNPSSDAPAFLKFCVKVYKWADKTFNSYDPEYVTGTGRKWKARLLSDNWVDSYYFNPGKKLSMRTASNIYSNLGAYIQFMAVSVGYSIDMNNLFGHTGANHRKFEFNFNCARFNIELHYWENTGGTFIRTFGNYNNGHLIKKRFDGTDINVLGINAYYFFNNKKYAMGAAYNFSKFQKKSAGTAILGFSYNALNQSVDLNKLPSELEPYLTLAPNRYRFHYNTYALMSGYSFNWVWNRHFLFNISAFPGIGFTHVAADSHSGNAKLFTISMTGLGSLTYNNGDFFVCAVAKLYGNWYRSNDYTFFSSVENAQLSIGLRF